MPFIGALIGWLTNSLAIRFLFWPYQPVKIPFTPWSLQGAIPKRQQELAATIGKVFEKELLSSRDLIEEMTTAEMRAEIMEMLSVSVKNRIEERLPRFLPLREVIAGAVNEAVWRESLEVQEELEEGLKTVLGKLNLAQLLENKIQALDVAGLEKLVLSVARREFKYIEALGAVLGFFIGLFQLGLAWLVG